MKKSLRVISRKHSLSFLISFALHHFTGLRVRNETVSPKGISGYKDKIVHPISVLSTGTVVQSELLLLILVNSIGFVVFTHLLEISPSDDISFLFSFTIK